MSVRRGGDPNQLLRFDGPDTVMSARTVFVDPTGIFAHLVSIHEPETVFSQIDKHSVSFGLKGSAHITWDRRTSDPLVLSIDPAICGEHMGARAAVATRPCRP